MEESPEGERKKDPRRVDVGNLVKDRRGSRSQKWLIEAAGLDRSQLSGIENGTRGVGLKVATRLQAVLGGEVSDYLTDARELAKLASRPTAAAERQQLLRHLETVLAVVEGIDHRLQDVEKDVRDLSNEVRKRDSGGGARRAQ